LRGTYIHKRLINRFACWCSNEYSYKIEELLDNLFTRQIIESKKDNLEKDNEIFERSVRVNINKKKLRIFKIENEKYKITCDSGRSDSYFGEVVNKYIFPAKLNIKQKLTQQFDKKEFSKDELPQLYEFINSLNPT
jgi:hypothetical protein